MLRRLRRPTTALVAVLLLAPALAACGSGKDTKSTASSGGGTTVPGVTITGDVGKAITAKWDAKQPKATSGVHTLVKGSGDKVASGDSISTYLWVGDATTKKVAYSDYQNGAAESIPNNQQVSPLFQKMFSGATYGSRVAATTNATELLGSASGGAQLGIGANDKLVVIADLVKKAPVSPTPSDSKAHDVPGKQLPKVVETKGKPSGLNWSGISKPSLTTPVRRVVLKKGTGPAVKATDTVTVNYLGEIYKAAKPFDESYTKTPLTQPLSGLIPGWKIGLAGVKTGSRVLLEIPPAYAYGAQGSGSTIPGNSTLWFVIDVVKTKG